MNIYDNNKIIGAIKKDSIWRLFSGTIAEWIMDYKANDPNYREDMGFRNGILQVDDSNAYDFIKAMEPNELFFNDIQNIKNNKDFDGVTLSVIIDFDRQIYVNSYTDLLLEDYVPKGWTGICDDVFKHVPLQIKSMFV